MINKDILAEIDETLDQLIRNAEAIEQIEFQQLSETELDAFQKTQESLLRHLLHMDELFTAKRNQSKAHRRSTSMRIQEKFLHFERKEHSYRQNISKRQTKLPMLSKRKAKRFLAISG